jgi:AsmA protein
MKKPFKIVALTVGGLLALMVVAAIALPMFFDPNNYRSKASDYVKSEYGRTLEIGDVKLSVFPWLRVKLSNVKMDNAKGFGKENFAEVGQLSLGVKLLPLIFDRKVEASAIELDGLKLHLAKNAQGQTNWDDFLKSKDDDKDSKDKDKEKDSDSFKLTSINVNGISVDDATLSYSDAQKGMQVAIDKLSVETGALDLANALIDGAKIKLASLQYSDAVSKKNYVIENLALKTGTLKPGKAADIDLEVTVNSSAPQARIELKVGGNVLANTEAQTYTVKGLALNADLSGAAVPGGKQNAKLDGDVFFDQGKGAARFSKAKLEAAGLVLTTDINASGLSGDNARLSGPITIAPFSPRDVMGKLGMKVDASDSTALTNASFSAQYAGTSKSASLSNVAIKLDQTNINGTLAVTDLATQAIEFALKGDSLDADRYLSPKAAKAGETIGSGGSESKKADINDIKLPTEALDKLNVNGTLTFNTLKLSGLKLSDVSLRLAGAKNSPKTQQLSAKLYGGQITANTRVGGGTPSYGLKTQLQALNAGPFLTDFMGKDYVTGLGNFTMDVSGNGNTVGELRRTLNGDLSFKLENGAVKGFNLAQVIRNGQSLLSGQAATMTSETKQTDFTSFSATAKIINGILQSDTLDAASPLFRLAGAGQVNLINETINYTAKPTIVASAEGQGGKGLDALRGITVPIKLSGSMYAPKYELALNDVLKDQAKSRLTDLIQQKLGGDKTTNNGTAPNDKQAIGNAIMGLFGKKQDAAQPAQAPAPAQPAATP